MLVRTIAGLLALPLFFLVIFILPEWGLPAAVAVLGAMAAYELLHAAGLAKQRFLLVLALVFATFVPVWAAVGCPLWGAALALLLFTVLVFAYGMKKIGRLSFESVAVTFFATLMAPLFFSLAVPVFLGENGKALVLLPFLAAWVSDTGAYFAGSLFGKHKLCPTVSPKKSVEGAVGAVVVSVAGHGLYAFLLASVWGFAVSYPAFLLAGAVGSAAGQFGDLIFSFIKRTYGVKDFGRLLPGHGGVLDRFDSVFLTTPVVFVLLSVMPFISA